jgi:hypothetical protein
MGSPEAEACVAGVGLPRVNQLGSDPVSEVPEQPARIAAVASHAAMPAAWYIR